MQTQLADFIKNTTDGTTADEILRKCVHCGFCTATCPTYQLLGDELDGPRGRIYLIKEVLEGAPVSTKTQLHLDRCLTCRACETTCPSGVRYGRLVDIGRSVVAKRVPRTQLERLKRQLLATLLTNSTSFSIALALGRLLRPLLPARLRRQLPPRRAAGAWPSTHRQRWMVTLGGCVQPAIGPHINAASARVLDRLGIALLAPLENQCCGAVAHHLNERERGLQRMRSNIDTWWPHLEAGAEAIVVTSSACALQIKEYAELLANDPHYALKAARVSAATKDLAEVVSAEDVKSLGQLGVGKRIAFHAPCTLQHGQRLVGTVERVLLALGFELTPVPDAHLCCGSAGTYSLLQGELSQQLLDNKLRALSTGTPSVIATANIGCYAHLNSKAPVPVRHWIELLDQAG